MPKEWRRCTPHRAFHRLTDGRGDRTFHSGTDRIDQESRPQTEGFSSALLEAMAQTDAAGQQAVLAVIAARHGSTPREIGAKMLVRTDGSIVGSVGGGIMEHRTILAAQEMLTGAAPAYQRLHFSADGKNDDAAIAACGGSMEIVLTRLQPGEEIK